MRWLRRKAPSASVRTPVIVPPPPAALFSEYIKKKPRRPSPVGTISSMLHAANPSGGVNEDSSHAAGDGAVQTSAATDCRGSAVPVDDGPDGLYCD